MSHAVKQSAYVKEHLGTSGLILIKPASDLNTGSENAYLRKDYNALQNLMGEYKLVLPNCTEMFEAMHENHDITNLLKSDGRSVYLREPCDLSEGIYLLERGKLTGKPAPPGLVDPDRRVRVWEGHNPSALFVLPDEIAHKRNYRFMIDSVNNPSFTTDIFIGIDPKHNLFGNSNSGSFPSSWSKSMISSYNASVAETAKIESRRPGSLRNTMEFLKKAKRIP